MDVVHIFCPWDMHVIPPTLCGFVAANQQYCATPGIKGIQNPIGPAGVLDAQCAQIAMPGSLDTAAMGKAQTRPEKPRQINARRYRCVFLCIQLAPPATE
ncbi:hypothetical protein AZH11_07670 [Pseudomonas simiae]|nr:hypothetical protein AZH11_07670 [Pseudomonas simiae]